MEIRLNKYLSSAGVCSRREADRIIEEGRVLVDGQPAQTGMKISEGARVQVDGKDVVPEEESVILAVHKPVGVVCTTDKRWGDKTLEEMVDYPVRVFSMGRLDKNSEGLILMTNQGDLLNRMMKAGNYHEKEYEVTVDKKVTAGFIERMSGGVYLSELDRTTRKCKVEKTGEYSFRIILTQGLNRQIRRMCKECGCNVVKLKRVRVMNIKLGDLASGAYRKLTASEEEKLRASLAASENNPELKYQ